MPRQEKTASTQPTLEQLVKSCNVDDLRAFLLAALAEDDRLARRFRQQFDPHDGPAAAADLMRDIEDLCEAYPSFISWRAAGSFEREYVPRKKGCRRACERLARAVEHVAKLPGGPAVRDQVVDEVIALYPRRPALREVLGRG